ncbi:MAG: hypothetical protein KI786_14180 [Mameliella sp.]|nr:hypothetical protein [Phaeodactylibacter sp.]
MENQQDNKHTGGGRRKALKGLIGLPFIGGIAAGAYAEVKKKQEEKGKILAELNINAERPEVASDMSGDPIRVGIVGNGGRGQHLVRVLGFATPAWLDKMKENENTGALEAYYTVRKISM